jgi:hypothetical protein
MTVTSAIDQLRAKNLIDAKALCDNNDGQPNNLAKGEDTQKSQPKRR